MESSNFIEVSPKIYKGDYDNYHSMRNIADRIASDIKFEEKCKKQAHDRDRKAKEKKNA